MNLSVLLDRFQQSPAFSAGGQAGFLPIPKNLPPKFTGSSAEFVGSIFMHPSCAGLNHMVVLNDAEDAAYFHNTLENLTSALDLFISRLLSRTARISNCSTHRM